MDTVEMYLNDKIKLEKIADANDLSIKDVIAELIEYGLEKMMDEYYWDKPKEEEDDNE